MSELTAKIHDFLSRNVILPLMGTQQALRPGRRTVSVAYREGLRFRRASQGWNDQAKRDWILERLRLTMRRANRQTVYYRNLFKSIGFDPEIDFTFDDFSRIPVLERGD